jgi:arylformamidase
MFDTLRGRQLLSVENPFKIMTIYDISVPLCSTMPTYPGDPGVEISKWMTLESGDAANVSFIKFGAHTGTHVDAPAHFIAGASPVECLPLDVLVGRALVEEIPSEQMVIDEEIVERVCLTGAIRILFKTRNSDFWNQTNGSFRSDFTYLSTAAAERLVRHGVKLVGIDYLSIEKFQSKDFATHHALLSHNVVIIEGLDLRAVTPGQYELICLPLRIRDGSGDGAPARAILRTIE